MKTLRLKDKKLWMWEGMMVVSLVISGAVYCGIMGSLSGRLSLSDVLSPALLYVMPCVLAGVVTYYMYGKGYGAGSLAAVQLMASAMLMWGETVLICGGGIAGEPEMTSAFIGLWVLGAIVPVMLSCHMAVRLLHAVEHDDWETGTSIAWRCRMYGTTPHRRETETRVAIYSRPGDIRFPAR